MQRLITSSAAFLFFCKTICVLLLQVMYYTSMTNSDQQTKDSKTEHPYVSEKSEGKPYAEWIVAAIVATSAILAFLGYATAATVVVAVTAVTLGVIRLLMRQRSPWKVRSVRFDSFISIALGIGLFITYASISLLL